MTTPDATSVSGPTTPAPVAPAWSLLVAEAVTGMVVDRLPMSALRWSIGLAFGSGHVCQPTVPLDGPPVQGDPDSQTYRVRAVVESGPRFMLVPVYGTRAVAYGFVSAPIPTPSGVTIGTLDLAGMLRRRAVIATGQRLSPSSAAADTTLGPASKPHLVRLLLLQALAETGGALPLDISSPATTGTETRTYSGFRLTRYTDALLDLSDDEDGPDIRVTPTLSADQKWIRLKVDIGQPTVASSVSHHFENPGNCFDVQPDYDMSQMGTYHYLPGDGTDQDKPIGVAYDGTYLAAGVPLMDRVDTTRSAIGDKPTLDGYARANAAVFTGPLESMALTVSADADPKLGSYAPGDTVTVRTSRHWWYGTATHTRTIVSVSGDHTSTVTISTAP